MSQFLQQKYIPLVASRFRNFKRKGRTLFQFSCPICNDSEKNSRKARGNFYTHKGNYLYHCYNCGVTIGFEEFLKSQNETLFMEYLKEKLAEKRVEPNDYTKNYKTPSYVKHTPLESLEKVSALGEEHFCRKYVEERKIPTNFHHKLFFAPDFYRWVREEVDAEQFQNVTKKEPRLIIPLIDKNGDLHGLQGRSFEKDVDNKYLTVITNELIPPVFGLDTVNFNKTIIALEGPIKSMFIENAISSCGGLIENTLKSFDKDNLIICYDNEPRKKETINKMKHALDLGYRVAMLPDSIKEKDVDDMVKNGYNPEYIKEMIEKHSFKGLEGSLKLKMWSKL